MIILIRDNIEPVDSLSLFNSHTINELEIVAWETDNELEFEYVTRAIMWMNQIGLN